MCVLLVCVTETNCDLLTVTHSNITNLGGKYGDEIVIGCDAGYASLLDEAVFTTTCSILLDDFWSLPATCEAIACPYLTMSNSDTTEKDTGVTTGGEYTVTCNNGFTSRVGTSFSANCTAVAPGVSGWIIEEACEAPRLLAISCCRDDANSTLDCPTEGMVSITLFGANFPLVDDMVISVSIDDNDCEDVEFNEQDTSMTSVDINMTCVLPEGAGSIVSVVICESPTFCLDTSVVSLLGYKAPSIASI